MSERERLDVLVKLALESRDDGSIKEQMVKARIQERVRDLPTLQNVLKRTNASQAISHERFNYTYGL